MKSSNRFLSLVFVCMFIACTKESANQGKKKLPVVDNETIENPISPDLPEAQPSERTDDRSDNTSSDSDSDSELSTIDKVNEIKKDIISGEIDFNDGLGDIGDILDDISDVDTLNRENLLDEIVNIVAEIEGDLTLTLAGLLRIELDSETDQAQNELDSLFAKLKAANGFEISVVKEEFIIKYLLKKEIQLSSTTDGLNTSEVLSYYKLKIGDLVDLDDNDKIKTIIERYSLLARLMSSKDVYAVFNKVINNYVLRENDSKRLHDLYDRYISELSTQSFIHLKYKMSNSMFNSALNHGIWIAKRICTEGSQVDGKYQTQSLDDILTLFDKYLLDITSDKGLSQLENVIKLLDIRSLKILETYRQTIKEVAQNGSCNTERFYPTHPLARIYYFRGLNEAHTLDGYDVNDIIATSFDDYRTSFYSHTHLSDSSTLSKTEQYHKDFYTVELSKFFLEMDGVFNLVSDNEKRKIYQLALNALVSATNIREGKKYKLEDFIEGKKTSSNNEFETDERTGNAILRKPIAAENCYSPTKYKNTGIHYVDAGIHFCLKNKEYFGNELRFHPLGMIMSPGRSVVLNYNKKVHNPWIDVSGLKYIPIAKSKSLNKSMPLKFVKKTTKLPDRNDENSKRKIHIRNYFKDTYSLKQNLVLPPKQTDGIQGQKGGDIYINLGFKGVLSGNAFLAAKGGDGSNGIKGFDFANNPKLSPLQVDFKLGNFFRWREIKKVYKCDYLKMNMLTNSYVEIGDRPRRVCSWEKEYEKNKTKDDRVKKVFKYLGGLGGNAGKPGSAGLIKINVSDQQQKQSVVFLDMSGRSGKKGQAGHGAK